MEMGQAQILVGIILLCLAMLLIWFWFYAQAPRKTDLDFVAEVKKFGEDVLGFVPTENFKEYKAKGKPVYSLYQVKTAISREADDSALLGAIYDTHCKKEFKKVVQERRKKGYTIFTRRTIAYNNYKEREGCPLSWEFLKRSKAEQARMILHEDFHGQEFFDCSHHRYYALEESAAVFAGFMGAMEFFCGKEISQSIKN